jgi:Lhr-like helicase
MNESNIMLAFCPSNSSVDGLEAGYVDRVIQLRQPKNVNEKGLLAYRYKKFD